MTVDLKRKEEEGAEKPKGRKRPSAARDVSAFERDDKVGVGTYGEVWKARNMITNEVVALKKVRMDNEREGFPLTAIREIKLLKMLNHENIVQLKEVVTDAENSRSDRVNIYMVFEYVDHDLTGLTDSDEINFKVDHVKCCMQQLLTGLHYCHQREVLHRDIKGSNILLSKNGDLKIADFGLARTCGESGRQYTNKVITRWYRPPELLLGATEYGAAIDMWSVGCLLAELLQGKPLFPGTSETDQMDLIMKLLGSPQGEVWAEYEQLPYASWIRNANYPPRLRQMLSHLGPDVLDLLEKLLNLDSKRRISAAEALRHRWFTTEPLPSDKSQLPLPVSSTTEHIAKQRQWEKQGKDKQQKQSHGGRQRPAFDEGRPGAFYGGDSFRKFRP